MRTGKFLLPKSTDDGVFVQFLASCVFHAMLCSGDAQIQWWTKWTRSINLLIVTGDVEKDNSVEITLLPGSRRLPLSTWTCWR